MKSTIGWCSAAAFILVSACSSSSTEDGITNPRIDLARTGQTTLHATGDDGDLQRGKVWPTPRFTVGVGKVTDTLTNLMWLQDGSMPVVGACGGGTTVTWQGALDYVACLNNANYLGHSDWRLSNTHELRSLVNYDVSDASVWLNTQGFINVQSDVSKNFSYWTSLSRIDNASGAQAIGMGTVPGFINDGGKTLAMVYAWPVRGSSRLAETGSDMCFNDLGASIPCAGTGQDGELQAGVAWNGSRFQSGSGAAANCITDTFTGLVWPKTHDVVYRTWFEALTYAQNLNYCGYTDWRLPNINEMNSLSHAGELNPAAWLTNQGFGVVGTGDFWTSTTHANATTDAWIVDLFGYIDTYSKNSPTMPVTWPVRGGR